jgi:hypothetical protein
MKVFFSYLSAAFGLMKGRWLNGILYSVLYTITTSFIGVVIEILMYAIMLLLMILAFPLAYYSIDMLVNLIPVGASIIGIVIMATTMFLTTAVSVIFYLLMFVNFRDKNIDLSTAFGISLTKRNLLISTKVSLLTGLYSLLLCIPGIVKYYQLALAPFIALDNENMSVQECLETSKNLMEGNKMKLFLIEFFIMILSLPFIILTLGIGSLAIYPILAAVRYHLYEKIEKK